MENAIPAIAYTVAFGLGVAIVFLVCCHWSWLNRQQERIGFRWQPPASRLTFFAVALGCLAWSVTGAADLLGFDRFYVVLGREWDIFQKTVVLALATCTFDVIRALWKKLNRSEQDVRQVSSDAAPSASPDEPST